MEENREVESDPIIIPQKNKINKFLIAVNVILLALVGYLFWNNTQQNQQIAGKEVVIDELEVERADLKDELEEMLAEYQNLETENEDLSAELEEEKLKIEELLKKVRNGSWEIHKLKKEAATLREIMKGYIVTIDSLNTLNQDLIAENTTVRKSLKNVKGQNDKLEKVNSELSNQVAIAQRLKAFNIETYGVRVKKDNTGRSSDKAKKIDKIRTCFTLSENKLSEAGNKEIYIRILTPDGRILSEKTDDSNRFVFNGVRGLFSIKKRIKYTNKEMQVCMDWKKNDEFPIGEYVVEIYCEEADIGKAKLVLR